MLGIKSQPLDNSEVLLFMAFWQLSTSVSLGLKIETVICNSQNRARARWKLHRQLCREKGKNLTERGTVQNTNEQYHVAKSYFLIQRGGIPVIL
jgi:hypothetical protein